MNRQSPGIGWCRWTWNPITGCRYGCSYCYVPRVLGRFSHGEDPMDPWFHPDRLEKPLKVKKPARIFVGSSGDMWGDWVPRWWIEKVLWACGQAPQHRFIFLTKNPMRYAQFAPIIPQNCWCGTSVTGGSIQSHEKEHERIGWLERAPQGRRFISLEPWLGFSPLVDMLVEAWISGVDWLIVGGLTGPEPQAPPVNELEELMNLAERHGVPVYVKDNAYLEGTWPKEFPEGLCVIS